jgi:hypothetical protein
MFKMSGLPCNTLCDPEVDDGHHTSFDFYGGPSNSSSSSSLATVVGPEDTKFDADRQVVMALSSPFADNVYPDINTATENSSHDSPALRHALIDFR